MVCGCARAPFCHYFMLPAGTGVGECGQVLVPFACVWTEREDLRMKGGCRWVNQVRFIVLNLAY